MRLAWKQTSFQNGGWDTYVSWKTSDIEAQRPLDGPVTLMEMYFFSEEVNNRQIGAEGQRNRCSEKGPFCLAFVKGEGCETQERLGCEIFTKLAELKLAILVLWWYA